MSALKPIPLSKLIEALEWDDMESDYVCLVDLQDGDVICVERDAYDDPADWLERMAEEGMMGSQDPEFLIKKAVANDHGGERFIQPPQKYDYHEYEKMRDFIDQLTDENAADQLRQAIRGKGAFRYFKDTLHRLDLIDSWYDYRHATMKEFVIAWADSHQVPYTDDT